MAVEHRRTFLLTETTQTTVNWVMSEPWFALKTRGANEASVGIVTTLVGSKSVERNVR